MSNSSRFAVSFPAPRRTAAVIAALALALAILAGQSGSVARAQSQCFNSNSGSSCTNYTNTGAVASTDTCTNETDGSSVCVTTTPNAPSTYSVCTDGACTSNSGTPASSVKESVVEAAGQVPSISYQPCNVPGKGLVWKPSQSITGRLLNC